MNWLVVFVILLATSLIVGIQTQIFLRLRRYAKRLERETTQQTKELLLYQTLDIRRPLPSMRGWAISPDIGWEYISLIFERESRVIVECGSGVSTILAAYALKRLGSGMVFAFDHEKEFAQKTTQAIRAHGLETYAQVVYAPLVEHTYESERFLWYDLSALSLPDKIDLLFVDGPPGTLQQHSRYGALPLLQHQLKNGASLLLDDTNREEEQEIIQRWIQAFPLQKESLKAEKGAVHLTFKPRSQPQTEHQERPELA